MNTTILLVLTLLTSYVNRRNRRDMILSPPKESAEQMTESIPMTLNDDTSVGQPISHSTCSKIGIRASVDALCRDGAEMRGGAQKLKSFHTQRIRSYKAFHASQYVSPSLLYPYIMFIIPPT